MDRWHEVQRLETYLDAMQTRLALLAPAERQSAREWLLWVRQYRDRINPLRHPLLMPPDPEFTPNLIAPFMPGWSAYGPTADVSFVKLLLVERLALSRAWGLPAEVLQVLLADRQRTPVESLITETAPGRNRA